MPCRGKHYPPPTWLSNLSGTRLCSAGASHWCLDPCWNWPWFVSWARTALVFNSWMPLWWWLSWTFFILVEHYGIESDTKAKIPTAASTSPSTVAFASKRSSPTLCRSTSSCQATPPSSSFPRPWFSCPVANCNVERAAVPWMGGMDMPPMWTEQWQIHRILRPLWDAMDARSLCLPDRQWSLASAARLEWSTSWRSNPATWTRSQTLTTEEGSKQRRWQGQRQRERPWPRAPRRQRCQQPQREEQRQRTQGKASRTGLGISGCHNRNTSPDSARRTATTTRRSRCCGQNPVVDTPQQHGWPSRRSSGSSQGDYIARAASEWTQPSFRSDEMDKGPRSTPRSIASSPNLAQCLAFLRRRGYESLGGLCCGFSRRRCPTSAAHPDRDGCFPASPERLGWTTCIGGTWHCRCCGAPRGRKCRCGYGCFPRAPKVEPELCPHFGRLGYHGDDNARSSRTIQCRDPRPRASRSSKAGSTAQGRDIAPADGSGDSCGTGWCCARRSGQRQHHCGGRRRARRWRDWPKWLFLIGRWTDPSEIAHQWPVDGAPLGLAWLHPVCTSDHFLSPWQANWDAVELAFECGNHVASSPSSLGLASSNRDCHAAKTAWDEPPHRKSLTFASHFELCIGLEDQSSFLQVTLPHEVLSTWPDKPWSLCVSGEPPGFAETRLLDGIVLPEHPMEQQTDIAGHLFRHPAVALQSDWVRSIWPTFVAGARFYQLRAQPTAYLRTWFLDDPHVSEWHRWRELEVDPQVHLWEDRLLALWRDQLRPPAPVQVFLVTPSVPPIPGWETHLGDLIVHQGLHLDRKAILTRTEVRLADEVRLQLAAYLVPARQPFHELMRRVRLMFHCWRHPCSVHRGQRLLVDGLIDHIQASGLSFLADMEPAAPLHEDTTALMQASAPRPTSSGLLDCGQHLRLGPADWMHELFGVWFRDGAIACDEVGPEIFVQTWYIHHDLQSTCFDPRTWVATSPRITWEQQLLELWEDVIDPTTGTHIYYVQPKPPATDWRHFSGHLVLVQGDPAYKAVLLTALYHDLPGVQTVQAAFSSLGLVDGHYLSRLLGASQACADRPCEVLLSEERFPLSQRFSLYDGLAFTLDVAPPLPKQEDTDALSLLAMVRLTEPAREPLFLMDNPEIVAVEAAQDFVNDEDECSTSDSGHWHPSIIYSVRIEEAAGHTDWSSYDELHDSAIDLLHPDGGDLVAVHHVAHPPWDHSNEDVAVFVAEFPEDLGRTYAMVLVDVGFFQNRPDERGDVTVRIARGIDKSSTRQQVLDFLGLRHYCDSLAAGPPGPGCLTWLNRALIPPQDLHPIPWAHGDYLRVALPPATQLPEDFPVRRAAALCHQGHSLARIGSSLFWRQADELTDDELLPLNLPPAVVGAPPDEMDDTHLMQEPRWICSTGWVRPEKKTGSTRCNSCGFRHTLEPTLRALMGTCPLPSLGILIMNELLTLGSHANFHYVLNGNFGKLIFCSFGVTRLTQVSLLMWLWCELRPLQLHLVTLSTLSWSNGLCIILLLPWWPW